MCHCLAPTHVVTAFAALANSPSSKDWTEPSSSFELRAKGGIYHAACLEEFVGESILFCGPIRARDGVACGVEEKGYTWAVPLLGSSKGLMQGAEEMRGIEFLQGIRQMRDRL